MKKKNIQLQLQLDLESNLRGIQINVRKKFNYERYKIREEYTGTIRRKWEYKTKISFRKIKKDESRRVSWYWVFQTEI